MYVDPNLSMAIHKDMMRRAERAAEIQRMLPKRERRGLNLHFSFPTIRRRARLATPHGC